MFAKFTIRIIGRSQKHSFRSIMGFALIIAMIVATSGVISGFSAQVFGITQLAGKSSSILIQAKDPSEGISPDLLDLINHTNIEKVFSIAERTINFTSKRGTCFSNIVGVNISELIDYYYLAEIYVGRLPQSKNSSYECLVGKDLQVLISSSEINISDNLLGIKKQLSIVGLIQNINEFQRSIIVQTNDYYRIFNLSSSQQNYQKIKIRLKSGRFIEETMIALRALFRDYQDTLTILPEQQADIFTSSLFSDISAQLNLLFSILFLIVLIRISHAISWFIQRYERDFLIMRSMGISSFQLSTIIFLLAFLIGNTGFLIGFSFGIVIPSLIFTLLTLFLNLGFLIPEFNLNTLLN